MLFTFYLKGWRWLTASAVWYSVYACTWVQTMTEALRVNETGLFFLSGLVTADRYEDVLILLPVEIRKGQINSARNHLNDLSK